MTFRRNAILLIPALFVASASVPAAAAAHGCGAGATLVVARKLEGKASDLWGLNSKGDRIRLTTDPRPDAEPSWSPDGRSIVFVRGRKDERALWRLDLATCKETRLTPDDVNPSDPDWGPEGLIAFTNSDDAGDSTIDLVNVGTGEISTWVDFGFNARNPSWSPVGDQIVYEGDADGDWDLYFALLGYYWYAQVTDEPGDEGSPAWAPDDDSIVFTIGGGLYTVDPDGSDVTSLPVTTWTSKPAWTPYGDGIVATYGLRIIGFDRDGEHPTAWHIRGWGVDVRPPSSHELWQDSLAKHSLRRAAAVARRYYVDHGTYDGITIYTMLEAIDDITWGGPGVHSTGPRFVSVDEQDSTFTAVARSDSGVFFAIQETDNAITTYAVNPGPLSWSAAVAEQAGVDQPAWPFG